MNLYEKIQDSMMNDDEPTDKISEQLEALYENCNEAEKKIVDEVLISLTGWSMESLKNL